MYYYYTIRLRVLYVAENGALVLCKQNILVVPELHSIFTHHCIHCTASFFFCESISRIQWPITERRTTTVWFYQQTCFFQLIWNLKLDPVLPICSRLRPLYLPIVRHKVLGALLITQKFPMTLKGIKGIKPREKAMYSGQLEMARLLVFPQYTFIT